MKNHEGCTRAYHRSSKAHYSKSFPEENISVMIGMYHPDGGTTGEFEVEWEKLSGNLVPRLKCFDDAWHALSQFKDLLGKMAELDEDNIQEPEFCELLDSLGIIDLTEYEKDQKFKAKKKTLK